MGDKQVTIMVVKVDLQCHRCYKKIKRILCKFPQIQDQVYDEKQNTVTIKVVCCSPEKIKEKIICKGGDTVKGIEIKVPEKPKPKEPEKPKEKPKEPEKPGEPTSVRDASNYKAPKPAPPPPTAPVPCVPWYPPPPAYPQRTCCRECFEGRPGGPCFYGCGPPGPPPCYQYASYYGTPVYDSYGGGRSGACSIM